jgi:hypothetical protein
MHATRIKSIPRVFHSWLPFFKKEINDIGYVFTKCIPSIDKSGTAGASGSTKPETFVLVAAW